MIIERTLKALVAAELFVRNGEGWHTAVRPPRQSELPWYVSALKTVSRSRHIEIGRGKRPLEITFRLKGEPR